MYAWYGLTKWRMIQIPNVSTFLRISVLTQTNTLRPKLLPKEVKTIPSSLRTTGDI